jgi:cell division protein FtsQ
MAAYAPHSFGFGHGDAPRAPLPADVRLMQATANMLFMVAGVAVCAAALAWTLRLPSFSLRAIRIDGEVARNSETTIRANAAPKLAGNFVTMDLQKARAAFESVPWVRHAVVRRVWPMRLAVSLEEHKPAALWAAADGNDRLVNSFGEVFEANTGDVEDDDLPRLQGPEGSAGVMLAMLRRLLPVLEPLQAGELTELALSPRGSWRVTLDKGATVELGRGTEDEVIERTQHFVHTLPQVVAAYQRPLESADLRHVGGFAVKLRGVTTSVTAPPVRKK